jgi:hypothetical protein
MAILSGFLCPLSLLLAHSMLPHIIRTISTGMIVRLAEISHHCGRRVDITSHNKELSGMRG